MSADVERRYNPFVAEARAKGEARTIGGYAAVFMRTSGNLGGFVERIAPSAFNKSRGDGWPDVIARYNHDDNQMLGSTGGGTLRLDVDDTGLRYEVDTPKSLPLVYELVERGDVRKSSFAFRTYTDGDEWGQNDQGFPLRTLLSVQLVDVAPVNLPAYSDTTVDARGIELALRSLAEKVSVPLLDVIKLASENELRRLFTRSDGPPAPKPNTFGPAALLEVKAKEDPAA